MKVFNVVLFLLVLVFAGVYYFWYMPNRAELDRLSSQNNDGNNGDIEMIQETRLTDEENVNGDSGQRWIATDFKCQNGVANKEAFKNCLVTNGWGDLTQETPLADIYEGYAILDGSKISTEPFANASRVHMHNGWVADEKGSIYTFDAAY